MLAPGQTTLDRLSKHPIAIVIQSSKGCSTLRIQRGLLCGKQLDEYPIGRLHGSRGFHRLAKCLHRYPRRRRDMIVGGRSRALRLLFCVLTRVTDHLPVSLSLALSDSG